MNFLANLRRDMWWSAPVTTLTDPSAATSYGDANATVGTDGVAYEKHAHLQYWPNAAVGAGDLRCYGVAMQNIDDVADNVPFRFKASSNSDVLFGVGFTDTVAGSLTATGVRFFGFGKASDQIVCVRPPASSPNLYSVFFAAILGGQTDAMVAMSIQRMLGQPDQYSASVY